MNSTHHQNDWIDELPLEDDLWLQLLVDNELSDGQRKRLLHWLDARDDQWRRCALRFVEAQATGGDLTALHAAYDQQRSTPAAATVRSAPARSSVRSLLAVAASLLAFALGFFAAKQFLISRPAVAEHAVQEIESETIAQHADLRETVAVSPTGSAAEEQLPSPAVESLTLVVPTQGHETDSSEITVPLVSASQSGAVGLLDWRSEVPPQVLEAMERSGHRLERSISHLPIRMDDGRKVVVPVEELRMVRNDGFDF